MKQKKSKLFSVCLLMLVLLLFTIPASGQNIERAWKMFTATVYHGATVQPTINKGGAVDLGTSTYPWQTIYVNSQTLENGEAIGNATDGDFTITFDDDAATLGELYITSSIDTQNIKDNDLYNIHFQANDDSSNLTNWVTIEAKILDASDDSEDSHIAFKTYLAGSSVTPLTMIGNNLTATGSYDATFTTTVAGGETGVYVYPSHTTNALTGELIGFRSSVRVDAIDSPSGSVIGGKFQAGNMGTGTDLSAVRGVYTEVVNKTPSGATTWTYARGVEVNMDLNQGTSGNVNTITNAAMFYGNYNLPTTATYATVTNGYGIYLGNEAVGGTGQALDAAIYIDDTSMSGGIKGWDYGIDMSGVAAGFTTADIKLSSGAFIFTGSAANGDAVYAEVGAKDATGSIYITTAGALYVQVANAGQAQDWEKATTTDAD